MRDSCKFNQPNSYQKTELGTSIQQFVQQIHPPQTISVALDIRRRDSSELILKIIQAARGHLLQTVKFFPLPWQLRKLTPKDRDRSLRYFSQLGIVVQSFFQLFLIRYNLAHLLSQTLYIFQFATSATRANIAVGIPIDRLKRRDRLAV